MKAQPFIDLDYDWWIANISTQALRAGPVASEMSAFIVWLDNKSRALYSRPFRAEEVPEMFEGWRLEDDSMFPGYIRTDIDEFEEQVWSEPQIYPPGISNSMELYGDDQEREVSIDVPPVTLGDFIADCTRAGISLEWNRENPAVAGVFGREGGGE